MPQVHRERGFQFFIYTHDHEPSHIHARKAGGVVIIELVDMRIREVRSMKPADVRLAYEITEREQEKFQRRWNEIRPVA